MIALKILAGIILIFLLAVFFLWIFTLFIDTKKEYQKDSKFYRWLLNAWTAFIVIVLRIHIKSTGLEKMPEGRYLLVQNHRSNYDPILTWYILRKRDNLSFISKEENFKIPFFGKIIHRCCFRAIDRENPKNAIRTIIDCSNLIKNDVVSIGVYPEGKRNKNSENTQLLPFHNGVLKIAQQSDVPLVVTTIKGTESIYKNIPFKKSVIEFDVVDVLYPKDIKKENTKDIGEKVEKLMLERLSEGN